VESNLALRGVSYKGGRTGLARNLHGIDQDASNPEPLIRFSHSIAICLAAIPCIGVWGAGANERAPTRADLLRRQYVEMQERLRRSPFQRPIELSSSESSTEAAAEVYALVDFPFASVSDALSDPEDWCDILTLHLNIKYCRASPASEGSRLDVAIGSKHDQPLGDAYWLAFGYRIADRDSRYLRVVLRAEEGPFATRDYRIDIEAVDVASERTFIHLSYSNAHGVVVAMVMKTYLGTVGRDKVGFTVVGTGPDGEPRYVGGTRGAVERNTMRYYLAIESFLGAASSTPPHERFEKRLHDWFAAIERYPRQLHELEESEYLAMKRNERSRQVARARSVRTSDSSATESSAAGARWRAFYPRSPRRSFWLRSRASGGVTCFGSSIDGTPAVRSIACTRRASTASTTATPARRKTTVMTNARAGTMPRARTLHGFPATTGRRSSRWGSVDA
jgi:hypothetical protein